MSSTKDHLNHLNSICDDAIEAAIEALDAYSASAHKKPRVFMAILARATTAMKAISLLSSNNHGAEAMMLGRSILELDINLQYILKQDTERRMEAYIEHGELEALLAEEAYEQHLAHPPNLPRRQRCEALRAKYPKARSWTSRLVGSAENGKPRDVDMRSRAVEAGLLCQYEIFYRQASSFLHGASTAVSSNLLSDNVDNIDKAAARMFAIGTQSDHAVELALPSLLRILLAVVALNELPPARIRRLVAELQEFWECSVKSTE